jgi:hypothetical protein
MMIRVECNFAASIGRYAPEDYIRRMDLTVHAYTAEGESVVVGKIAADQLLLSAAELDGEPLISICDADSSGMVELFEALFENGYEFQPELDIEEVTDHVIFLWNMVLHPRVAPFEAGILDTVCDLLGKDCAVVMRRNVCLLSDKELADLHFCKIAGTDFVFRHLAFQSEFTKVNPQGVEVPLDFEANLGDDAWVFERWNVEP